MSEPQLETLQLVGRHVPDQSVETDQSGHKYAVPLPGVYEVGVVVGGTFMAIRSFKAGNVLNADGSPKNPPSDQPAGQPQAPSGSGGEGGGQ